MKPVSLPYNRVDNLSSTLNALITELETLNYDIQNRDVLRHVFRLQTQCRTARDILDSLANAFDDACSHTDSFETV